MSPLIDLDLQRPSYVGNMKREIDTTRMDRDMAHARRVSHTDFHGTVHPTLSLGILRQMVVWGVCGVPSHAPKNRNGGCPP